MTSFGQRSTCKQQTGLHVKWANPPQSRQHADHETRPPISRQRSTLQPSRQLSDVDEYDMPQLPPLNQIKGAITRQRVSQGISYLLPMDAAKNSIENVYSTNLRLVFKEPYLRDNGRYDENRLRASAREHFQTNIGPARRQRKSLDSAAWKKISVKEYTGSVKRALNKRAGKRLRSDAYISKECPTARTVDSDAEQQHINVDDLINKTSNLQIDTKNDQEVEAHQNQSTLGQESMDAADIDDVRCQPQNHKEIMLGQDESPNDVSLKTDSDQQKNVTMAVFSEAVLAKQKELPDKIKTPFLDEDKAHDIWLWLNEGAPQTDSGYLLEVCS